MRRLIFVATSVALLLAIFAPTTLAAGPSGDQRSTLIAIDRSVDIPAGDHVDTLIVVGADTRISGDVGTIVVASGDATLSGATADSLLVVDGHAALETGTTVSGDVRTINGSVTQAPGATVGGTTKALDADFAALAWLLVPFAILFFIGFAILGLAAALFVAAFASRQVRSVERLISHEPGLVLVAGIASSILLPTLAVLLMLTIVGAPIGLGLLFVLLPAMSFLAWLVAAIWVGDWILIRTRGAAEPDRPYLAAVLGVIVLAAAGLIPLVSAIATLFGFGALVLAAWRMLRRETPQIGSVGTVQPTPSAG
jgi:hypothetical protein